MLAALPSLPLRGRPSMRPGGRFCSPSPGCFPDLPPSVQGLFVLLFHCVLNREVRKHLKGVLAGKKPHPDDSATTRATLLTVGGTQRRPQGLGSTAHQGPMWVCGQSRKHSSVVCVPQGGGVTEPSVERASRLPGRGLAVPDLLSRSQKDGPRQARTPDQTQWLWERGCALAAAGAGQWTPLVPSEAPVPSRDTVRVPALGLAMGTEPPW